MANQTHVHQILLDRFVDGELDDAQERALLAQLDQTPGAWRHCALAFVEARCWQRAIDDRQPGAPSHRSPPATRRNQIANQDPANDRYTGPRLRWTMMLAAVFLLAFGVGTFLPQPWRHVNPVARPSVPDAPVDLVDHSTAHGDSMKPTNPNPADALVQDGTLEAGGVQSLDGQPIGNLTLVNNTGEQIDVPVYDWSQGVAEQVMHRSQPLSPDVIRKLKRHEVRSHQRYIPVQLKDGRIVVIPVQELDIVPVETPAY